MALTLNTPISINDIVDSLKINSFSVDLDNHAIFVAYSEMNSINGIIAEKTITIVEPDFTQAITDASTSAGADVYAALKSSLYTQVSAQTALSGVVV